MAAAIKHAQPRCFFFNTCPIYITTNNVPDFGEEQENIERQLAIFQTRSLVDVTVGADKWIHDNAMACVSWIASETNANLCHIEREERWYE